MRDSPPWGDWAGSDEGNRIFVQRQLHGFAAETSARYLCAQTGLLVAGLLPLSRAHAQDIRSGRGAQCQPQYAPRVGTPIRLSQAPANGWQAPSLYARGSCGAARRPAGGAVDLLGDLTRA